MHAVLAPSAAHRWVNCPGSVKAAEQYPSTDSDASREGTAAHELAAELVARYARAVPAKWADWEGKVADNGVPLTEEMFEAALIYAEDVQATMREAKVFGGDGLRIEQPVTIPRVHDLNFGTPDCSIWDASTGRLTVWDFKYGRKAVEARKNWQMIEYAIGLLDEITGSNALMAEGITVDMRIIQPRAYHPNGLCRGWKVNGADLRGYCNQLKLAADLSQQEEPPAKAGEWCKYCPGGAACLTLQQETAGIADRVETLQLIDLSPQDTATELRYLQRAQDLVKERLTALEAQALEQIRSGTDVPGYAIGHGRGSTVWGKSDAEVIALGDLMGVQLRKPEEAITPKQALKLNVDQAVINSYSKKRQGAAKLVPTTDTIASRVFGNEDQ